MLKLHMLGNSGTSPGPECHKETPTVVISPAAECFRRRTQKHAFPNAGIFETIPFYTINIDRYVPAEFQREGLFWKPKSYKRHKDINREICSSAGKATTPRAVPRIPPPRYGEAPPLSCLPHFHRNAKK